jgi:hypothetical protein
MTRNVGGIDRILRIVVGLGLLSFAVLSTSDLRWWGLIGIVPLLSAVVGFCPAYTLLGLNTCKAKA